MTDWNRKSKERKAIKQNKARSRAAAVMEAVYPRKNNPPKLVIHDPVQERRSMVQQAMLESGNRRAKGPITLAGPQLRAKFDEHS